MFVLYFPHLRSAGLLPHRGGRVGRSREDWRAALRAMRDILRTPSFVVIITQARAVLRQQRCRWWLLCDRNKELLAMQLLMAGVHGQLPHTASGFCAPSLRQLCALRAGCSASRSPRAGHFGHHAVARPGLLHPLPATPGLQRPASLCAGGHLPGLQRRRQGLGSAGGTLLSTMLAQPFFRLPAERFVRNATPSKDHLLQVACWVACWATGRHGAGRTTGASLSASCPYRWACPCLPSSSRCELPAPACWPHMLLNSHGG